MDAAAQPDNNAALQVALAALREAGAPRLDPVRMSEKLLFDLNSGTDQPPEITEICALGSPAMKYFRN